MLWLGLLRSLGLALGRSDGGLPFGRGLSLGLGGRCGWFLRLSLPAEYSAEKDKDERVK